MKITILGSGTILSPVKRNPAGYLLEFGDSLLLLEIGPGILRRLKHLNVDLTRISTIAISHFHPDHCSDLLPFLLNRYLLDSASNERLHILGPENLNAWFEAQLAFQGAWLNEHIPRLHPWQNAMWHVDDWEITAQPNGHTQHSLSFLIRPASQSDALFYSGDTGYNPALLPLAQKASWGVLECSLPDHLKQETHLTPQECGQFATLAGWQRVVLTHIYPENDTPDLAERTARHFRGKIIVARDFLHLP
jgi:ribonuclease BN (tRNA processing enzyme)